MICHVLVCQANWRKVGGGSPLERRSNRSTFLREPCVCAREGAGEASAAVWAGRAIEQRKDNDPGRRDFRNGRRPHRLSRFGERHAGPAVSETPMHVRTPSVGTLGGLRTALPVVAGPHRERRNPKPVMDGSKKSDEAIVPAMPANKGAHAPAEPAEERAATEGNPAGGSTRRTQRRASVPPAASRIRTAAERNPKERLTALFHHLTPEALGAAYFALKKEAAAGVDA